MYKKALIITSLLFFQTNIPNDPNLKIDILNLKDLKEIVAHISEEQIIRLTLTSGIIVAGTYAFCLGGHSCIQESQNDKLLKKYIIPGGFMCTGLALLLLSPKISRYLVKK